jgi:hypothetical protein
MLYLFSGDDTKNKLLAYEKFIKSLPRGMEIFFISRNNFDPDELSNFYSGAGLFFAKCAVVFSGILEAEGPRELVVRKLQNMSRSESLFVFLEGKLNKPLLDAFKKALAGKGELNIFDLPKEKKEKFNSFLLASAFGEKDKLNLWIYYRMAIEKGVGMEELSGVLFWKIKDMLLKKNFNKFSKGELSTFASKLSYLLPEARKKGKDPEIALEQFLLKV